MKSAKSKAHASSKTNITLKLDRNLLREIRILAAQEDTSISTLVSDRLRQVVNNKKARDVAKMKSLARMRKGYNLGFTPPASRDELYER
jgi:hypothetical protein